MTKKSTNKKTVGHKRPTSKKKDTKSTIKKDVGKSPKTHRDKFPKKFPFWARLRIGKRRPTLVIDEEDILDKKEHKIVPGFVDRESIHAYKKGRMKLSPNPDKNDPNPMYLKSPRKKPQELFTPMTKKLDMPKELIDMYDKNNYKQKK